MISQCQSKSDDCFNLQERASYNISCHKEHFLGKTFVLAWNFALSHLAGTKILCLNRWSCFCTNRVFQGKLPCRYKKMLPLCTNQWGKILTAYLLLINWLRLSVCRKQEGAWGKITFHFNLIRKLAFVAMFFTHNIASDVMCTVFYRVFFVLPIGKTDKFLAILYAWMCGEIVHQLFLHRLWTKNSPHCFQLRNTRVKENVGLLKGVEEVRTYIHTSLFVGM